MAYFYFVSAAFRCGGQHLTLNSTLLFFPPSIHYMPTAVFGQVKMRLFLVPPTVVFLVPLASTLRRSEGTLFFIYNGKMMPEIFTTTREEGSVSIRYGRRQCLWLLSDLRNEYEESKLPKQQIGFNSQQWRIKQHDPYSRQTEE